MIYERFSTDNFFVVRHGPAFARCLTLYRYDLRTLFNPIREGEATPQTCMLGHACPILLHCSWFHIDR